MLHGCPILPTNPDEVYQAIYTDAQEPQGFVSALQRALFRQSMVDSNGEPLVIDGLYGPATAFALRSWMQRYPAYAPDLELLRLTGDASDRFRVADANAYFSLGLDCADVTPVRGATPGAVFVERALEQGAIDLRFDPVRFRAARGLPRQESQYEIAHVDLTQARDNAMLQNPVRGGPYRGAWLRVLQAGGAPWQIRLSSPYADPFSSDMLPDGSILEMEVTAVYVTNDAAPAGTAQLILLFGAAY